MLNMKFRATDYSLNVSQFRFIKSFLMTLNTAADMFPETRRLRWGQKAVSLGELDRYLEEGREFLMALPNGKVIVKRV